MKAGKESESLVTCEIRKSDSKYFLREQENGVGVTFKGRIGLISRPPWYDSLLASMRFMSTWNLVSHQGVGTGG